MSKGKFGRISLAKAAVAAGLAMGMLAGGPVAALAQPGLSDTPVDGEYSAPDYTSQTNGESSGDTKLYVIARQDALATPESAIHENIRVTIPVAIHYVADGDGTLTGPTDDCVEIVNNTKLGAVHVSKIAVTSEGQGHITYVGEANNNDEVGLTMTPEGGDDDELANYLTSYDEGHEFESFTPMYPEQWDIADPTTGDNNLFLNNLTGRIGGFRNLYPGASSLVGCIHWTVRSGTFNQACEHDASVTIHYNCNDGSNTNCIPLGDQVVKVLDSSLLPDEREADVLGMRTPVTNPNAFDPNILTAPKDRRNANGTTTKWVFDGWWTTPGDKDENGLPGTKVEKVSDLGDADIIAGQIYELYAHYAPTTYNDDGTVADVQIP